jgi:hypothetical protein
VTEIYEGFGDNPTPQARMWFEVCRGDDETPHPPVVHFNVAWARCPVCLLEARIRELERKLALDDDAERVRKGLKPA